MMEHKELRPGVHTARMLFTKGTTDSMVRLINTGKGTNNHTGERGPWSSGSR